MLRCHRSGRLYRNIQGLGFFQIPHPCLGIALQTLCAKQLPSPTWKHSTTWQRVFRSRASFPGGKSHWQKIFTRANRTQTKRQCSKSCFGCWKPLRDAGNAAQCSHPLPRSGWSPGPQWDKRSGSVPPPAGTRGTAEPAAARLLPWKKPRGKNNICQRRKGQKPTKPLF